MDIKHILSMVDHTLLKPETISDAYSPKRWQTPFVKQASPQPSSPSPRLFPNRRSSI